MVKCLNVLFTNTGLMLTATTLENMAYLDVNILIFRVVFLHVTALVVKVIHAIVCGEHREQGGDTVKFPTFRPRTPG